VQCVCFCQEIQPTTDLDLSEDEELQQAFDMHSLIVSNVHQEPLFTAEQVIKEIEDMLEVNNVTFLLLVL